MAYYFSGCENPTGLGDKPIVNVNDPVQTIGVTTGGHLLRNNDSIGVPLNAVVNVSDTSIGPVINDSTRWIFYRLDGSVWAVYWGKDATHNYNNIAGKYMVSKRVKGISNTDSMFFYYKVGFIDPPPVNFGEQIVSLGNATYNSANGNYSKPIGFNISYLDGGSDTPTPLNRNDIVVQNGIRYYRVALESFDSTWHLAYGCGDTTGSSGNWNYANLTGSQWLQNGVAVIMFKSGEMYRIGMTTYPPAPGNSGDTLSVRKTLRWESITIGGVVYYKIYVNQRCVRNGDHRNPYVRYKLPNSSNQWNVANASYEGLSTGFSSILIPKSAFTGNGEMRIEFYSYSLSGTLYEATYDWSRYVFWDADGLEQLRGFWN